MPSWKPAGEIVLPINISELSFAATYVWSIGVAIPIIAYSCEVRKKNKCMMKSTSFQVQIACGLLVKFSLPSHVRRHSTFFGTAPGTRMCSMLLRGRPVSLFISREIIPFDERLSFNGIVFPMSCTSVKRKSLPVKVSCVECGMNAANHNVATSDRSSRFHFGDVNMHRIAQAASKSEALVDKAVRRLNAFLKLSQRAVPVICVVRSCIPRALFKCIFQFKRQHVSI